MSDASDHANDIELELAMKLVDSIQLDEDHSNWPDSISSRISPAALNEFKQAQECLNLLRLALPNSNAEPISRIHRSRSDEETVSDANGTPIGIPTRLGRFKIVRELGRGGFGVVLLAHDETLDRAIALKIPRSESLLSLDSKKRFQREARAAALLSHPAIVPIYESGQFGPIQYIAFAYCEGTSLAQWLKTRAGEVSPELAGRMIARLADAVGHAHNRGVIHRDLKPTNIMISLDEDDEPDCQILVQSLRITDFGLAVVCNDNENLTREGAVLGTPAFMAPEQAHGNAESTSTVDIYSLGVILFQLLTGEVPFQGESNLAVLKAITETAAPSPRKFNRSVPHDLAAICLKCLEKVPAKRYLSAGELSDDLNRFLGKVPVRARRRTFFQQSMLLMQRNPLTALLLGLLLLSLIGGFATTFSQYRQSQDNLKKTELNYQQAKRAVDELLGQATSIELEGLPRVRQEMLESVLRFYHGFIEQGQADPDLQWELAVAYRNVGRINMKLGKHRESLENYQRSASVLDQIVDNDDAPIEKQLERFNNQIDIGLQFDLLRRLDDAREEYQFAIENGQRLAQRFPEDVEVKVALGRVYKNLGYIHQQIYVERQNEEAEVVVQYYQQSLNIRENLAKQYPDNDEYQFRLALSHSTLAGWYIHERQYEKALSSATIYHNRLKRLVEKYPAKLKYRKHYAASFNRLSDVWRSSQHQDDWPEQAIRYLQQAEEIERELVRQHPLFADLRNQLVNSIKNQADIHRRLENRQRAVDKYFVAIQIMNEGRELIGFNDFSAALSLVVTYRLLGAELEKLGEPERALKYYNLALNLSAEIKDNDNAETVDRQIVSLLFHKGRLEYARQNYSIALDLLQQYVDSGGNHREAPVRIVGILMFGDPVYRDYQRALEITSKLVLKYPNHNTSHAYHGAALYFSGDIENALRHLDKATKLFGRKRYESFIRSMCYAKIGDQKRAKQELEIATKFLRDRETKSPNSLSINEFHSMRNEAQNAIDGS